MANEGLPDTPEDPSPALIVEEVLGNLEPEGKGVEYLETGDKEEGSSNDILVKDVTHDGDQEEDKFEEHLEEDEEEDDE